MIDWLDDHGAQLLAALTIAIFLVAPMVIYAYAAWG
jgi:hypothetical protein